MILCSVISMCLLDSHQRNLVDCCILLLLLLRTAYDEVAASTSHQGLGLQYCLRQGEEDYQDFHREPERSRKLNIVNKDSKLATGRDTARMGTECRFWSRMGITKVPLKISCHSWQIGGRKGESTREVVKLK